MSGAVSADESDYRVKHLGNQSRSGLSVAEYCRRHDLCQATFYNWRRHLGIPEQERAQRGAVSFTEIARVAAAPTQWAAEIELASGAVIRVAAQVDAPLLRALVEILG